MVKKLLVCGATGFLGTNLVNYFKDKDDYEVYGTYCNTMPVHDDKIEYKHANLCVSHKVDDVVKGMDVVIQMAGVSGGAYKQVYDKGFNIADNLIINPLVFKSCVRHRVGTVLFPSCTTVYHDTDVPLKEDDVVVDSIHPVYRDGAMLKLLMEGLCSSLSGLGSNDTRFVVFRHSNVFGRFDKFFKKESHVMASLLSKAFMDKGFIDVWGDGGEIRDYLYIDDFLSFVEKAIVNYTGCFNLVNVGGESCSISDLAEKIVDVSGYDMDVKYLSDKPSIPVDIMIDSSLAYEKFNWRPQFSLDEGIRMTWEWMKNTYKIDKR